MSSVNVSETKSANVEVEWIVGIPPELSARGANFGGDFHTHPRAAGQEGFSRVDNKQGARYPRYLRTPAGNIRVLRQYNPDVAQPPGELLCTGCLPRKR